MSEDIGKPRASLLKPGKSEQSSYAAEHIICQKSAKIRKAREDKHLPSLFDNEGKGIQINKDSVFFGQSRYRKKYRAEKHQRRHYETDGLRNIPQINTQGS